MSYTHPPRGDVKRLPKWAQEHITALQVLIDRLEGRIMVLSSEHPGSNVAVRSTLRGKPDTMLPANSIVYFYVGDSRDKLRDSIEVMHHQRDNNSLIIRAYGMGSLLITPSASNSIEVKIGER